MIRTPSPPRSRSWVAAVATLPFLIGAPVGCKKKNDGPSCTPDDEVFEKIRVVVQPTESLNLDEEGNPLSVQFRVYQLSGDESLQMIDFEQVWQEGGKVAFGDDYLGEEEITVYPDRSDVIELKPETDARFVVAVAIFREPLGQDWFRVWEVPQFHGHSVCSAKKQKQPWPDPCFHVMLDRYTVEGGHTAPAGWDADKQALECPGAPMKTAPPLPADDDDKKKKKKKKKLKLGDKAAEAEDAEAPTAPEGPAGPEAPGG